MTEAKGVFQVKLQPLDISQGGDESLQMARLSIDKTFEGELQAESKGEMLSARSSVEGSAAYVALEQLHGELQGRKGSFALQHYGRMQKDSYSLQLEIVPDSGSGELEGISGSMQIEMREGKHYYNLQYQLPRGN